MPEKPAVLGHLGTHPHRARSHPQCAHTTRVPPHARAHRRHTQAHTRVQDTPVCTSACTHITHQHMCSMHVCQHSGSLPSPTQPRGPATPEPVPSPGAPSVVLPASGN